MWKAPELDVIANVWIKNLPEINKEVESKGKKSSVPVAIKFVTESTKT